ncbi:asparagine--tRNA ligase, mitochondrial [Rhodnius prolixus]
MSNIGTLRINTLIKTTVIRRQIQNVKRIADILHTSPSENSSSTIKGWVRAVRKMKDNVFVDVDDGSCAQRLQVVLEKTAADSVDYGSSVEVTGHLSKTPSGQLELKGEDIVVLGAGKLNDGYPFAPRKSYSTDYCRQYLHLRPRIAHFASVLRIRNAASIAIRKFFQEKNYIEIHTPILTSNDCEGAGEVFTAVASTTSPKELFFDVNAYLTVSAQLHLEVMARSLSQVYCFGPTFRAENSKSRFHLAEFYMLEAETALVKSVEDLTSFIEDMLKHICNNLLNTNEPDVELCRKKFSESNFKLEQALQKPWITMTYNEAANILKTHSTSLKVPHKPDTSFTKEHELFLTNHNNNTPIFLVEWPVTLKPFYMRINRNDNRTVDAFDLIFPSVGEICGGSLREDDFNRLKVNVEKIKGLEWYLELRKFGNVLTGGFGIGFDRFLMALLNVNNIKDTIPFPRFPHHCQI